jgi:uncharacterized protein (TIGR02246 family)
MRNAMTAEYLINAAKTEFREGYNTGDAARVLSVFSPNLSNFAAGQPTFWGEEALAAMHARLEALFAAYKVDLFIIVAEITLVGEGTAFVWGWHKFTLMPKAGGAEQKSKERYCELWKRQPDGAWKIEYYMTNQSHPAELIDEFRQRVATLPAVPN